MRPPRGDVNWVVASCACRCAASDDANHAIPSHSQLGLFEVARDVATFAFDAIRGAHFPFSVLLCEALLFRMQDASAWVTASPVHFLHYCNRNPCGCYGHAPRLGLRSGQGAPGARTDLIFGRGRLDCALTPVCSLARHFAGDLGGDKIPVARTEPLDEKQFNESFDEEGRIQRPSQLRLKVFTGGAAPNIRGPLWEFLLGMWSPLSVQP